jgi:hypothetical protein
MMHALARSRENGVWGKPEGYPKRAQGDTSPNLPFFCQLTRSATACATTMAMTRPLPWRAENAEKLGWELQDTPLRRDLPEVKVGGRPRSSGLGVYRSSLCSSRPPSAWSGPH